MVLIYSPQITNRLRYACDLIFQNLLGIPHMLTSDTEAYSSSTEAKLCYADSAMEVGLFLQASHLLLQKGIKTEDLQAFPFEDTVGFFATSQNSIMPFDMFAASFYLASRYEEYTPYPSDKFGRFPAEESLAFKHNFLHQPVVDIWALKLKQILLAKYPDLKFKQRKYSFIPTVDVDSAYSYLNKGLVRTVGGYLKSIRDLDTNTLVDRTKVLMRRKADPFDTFDWQYELHKSHDLKPIYFLLVGDYDEYDKNVSVHTLSFQSLIKSIADNAEVGIHPSYASNESFPKLKKEIDRLSKVLKREIKKSRQHFLKLKLPQTYQNLSELDVTDDYTMGYASHLGFRAGLATPFYFYNLDQEMVSNLKVHPFCLMDATLNYYLHMSKETAIIETKKLIDEVKKVKGNFVTIWHNNSLSEEKEWIGWRDVYTQIVKEASP